MALAGLGAVAYLAAAIGTDAGKLRAALEQLGWIGCALVLALSTSNYLLRFLRWQLYIAHLGHRLGSWHHLVVYLSGFALTVSPGKGGEAVRSLYLREHGVAYSESIAALFVERLVDFLSMVILAGFIAADARAYAPLLAGALAATLIVVSLLGRAFLADLVAALGRRSTGRLGGALTGLSNLLRCSHRLLQPRLLLAGLVLGVVAWGAEGLGFHRILQGLQLDLGAATATGIYAIAALAGAAAFFMPGGIGGMEVVMTTMLVARGATLPVAVIATLLCRLATLWFAVLIGIVCAMIVETWPRPEPMSSTP